jgi:hypothetical protein
MNQEAFERLKIKNKRLDAVPEPHIIFFLLEEPVKLKEAGRLPVRDYLNVICSLDPCRTLAFFVF